MKVFEEWVEKSQAGVDSDGELKFLIMHQDDIDWQAFDEWADENLDE